MAVSGARRLQSHHLIQTAWRFSRCYRPIVTIGRDCVRATCMGATSRHMSERMNRKMRRAQKQKLRADTVPAVRGSIPTEPTLIARRVASLFSESLRCLASGQTAKAVVLCDRILSLKPDLPEAHCNRGVALAQLGKLHDAEQAYRQVIALRPDHPEAYSNLGEVLRCLGRLDDADKAVRYAIALQPQFADAFSNLGNTQRERGSLTEAEAAYREALALKPDFPEAHNNLGTVLVDLGRPAGCRARPTASHCAQSALRCGVL
jgi:tetratricopeptide (TPR) repeat protein